VELKDWNAKEDFQAFMSSKDMMSFASHIIPLVTETPRPQLYETSLRPLEVLSSNFTEVLRLRISDESKISEAQGAWKVFNDAVLSQEGTATISNGLSVNLPEKMVFSAIGWNYLEVSGVESRT